MPSRFSTVASTSSSPPHGSSMGSRTVRVAALSGPTRRAGALEHGAGGELLRAEVGALAGMSSAPALRSPASRQPSRSSGAARSCCASARRSSSVHDGGSAARERCRASHSSVPASWLAHALCPALLRRRTTPAASTASGSSPARDDDVEQFVEHLVEPASASRSSTRPVSAARAARRSAPQSSTLPLRSVAGLTAAPASSTMAIAPRTDAPRRRRGCTRVPRASRTAVRISAASPQPVAAATMRSSSAAVW